jgi:DNA polymerase-4
MNPKSQSLNNALDEIRAKHGQKAIFLGSEKDGWSAAPMRISFTHIPDLGVEDR